MADQTAENRGMRKVCIFCGRAPKDKNKEHVLPQWLLKITGKPTRSVYLGRDWSSSELTERFYSFQGFTFPACKSCNSAYSSLEHKAEVIVRRML